jgi:hypothetical protein
MWQKLYTHKINTMTPEQINNSVKIINNTMANKIAAAVSEWAVKTLSKEESDLVVASILGKTWMEAAAVIWPEEPLQQLDIIAEILFVKNRDGLIGEILQRKADGQDCTEEESGHMKQLIKEIMERFPNEFGEALEEQQDPELSITFK